MSFRERDGGYQRGGGGRGGGGGGRGGYGRRDDRGGHGGGRGRHPHRNEERRGPPPDSLPTRMRKMIVEFGDHSDFNPEEDLPGLSRALRKQYADGKDGILHGFRIGITQQPYKLPLYAALVVLLSRTVPPAKSDETSMEDAPPPLPTHDISGDILTDITKGMRYWLDNRMWLKFRLSLQFLALLVPAGLIDAQALLNHFKSFLSIVDEMGGGGERAERMARAVGEALMRVGDTLYAASAEDTDAVVATIESYILSRRTDAERALLSSLSPFTPSSEIAPEVSDSLSHLLAALRNLRENAYTPPAFLPVFHTLFELKPDQIQSGAFDLPDLRVPPETDEPGPEDGEGRCGLIKFFGEEVVLPVDAPAGWLLRSTLVDMLELYEINRKECARLLLVFPSFLEPGVFKPPPSSTATTTESKTTLSLESLIVSTILSAMFALPRSAHKSIYYASVLTELCKLSPSTVAPPVGRAVRKLFTMLGTDGLDLEVARRAADWFSVHLSNFGFQWMWKEWIPDLTLPSSHPKRAFMRRVVELEIRLAYHDRIMQTLPEPMLEKGQGVIADQPPEPTWRYAVEGHPLQAEAKALHTMYRQKTPADDVVAHLNTLASPLTVEIRSMALETLLQLGSRSFSHFLNATERYLPLLRALTQTEEERRTVLDSIAAYWSESAQMRVVVVDKYLQYGVVDGLDVVHYVFDMTPADAMADAPDAWTDFHAWEMLRMALDKIIGRVAAARRRAAELEADDDKARARRAAEHLEHGGAMGMDVDPEAIPQQSPETLSAQKAIAGLVEQQDTVLVAIMKSFVAELLPWCFGRESQGLSAVLTLVESGEDGQWPVRARWGWYREFVRAYQRHLMPLVTTIESEVLDKVPGGEGEDANARAESFVRGVWSIVAGGE